MRSINILNDTQCQVKLGIEAPDEIEICREEIFEKIQESKDTQAIDLGH